MTGGKNQTQDLQRHSFRRVLTLRSIMDPRHTSSSKLTLTLPGPSAGVGGSLTVTVA